MKKEKKALVIGLVVGVLVALIYCNFFAPRYEIKKEGSVTLKIDRWTGQSWNLVNDNWKKMADRDEDWEEIDRTLSDAMKLPFARIDSEYALKKLRDANPVLKNIPDDELLERIKLVYSKMVLVNMYLGEFVKVSDQASSETVATNK
jgi:hypothetical protein